jgi:hypothetical protein
MYKFALCFITCRTSTHEQDYRKTGAGANFSDHRQFRFFRRPSDKKRVADNLGFEVHLDARLNAEGSWARTSRNFSGLHEMSASTPVFTYNKSATLVRTPRTHAAHAGTQTRHARARTHARPGFSRSKRERPVECPPCPAVRAGEVLGEEQDSGAQG